MFRRRSTAKYATWQSKRHKGRSNWDSFSTTLTAAEALGRNFASDQGLEDQLSSNLDRDPCDTGTIVALCEGWPKSAALQALRSRLRGEPQLSIPVSLKLMSVITPTDRLIEALVWAANELQGDLWESLAHWIPSVIRRLKEDDTAYAQMRDALFAQPSPGVKASFPGLLGRARDLTEDLRSWCRSESQRAEGIW
jgi:hypothetical protein